MQRKYLLVGYSASGISMTANCLYNSNSKDLNTPFPTLDSYFQNAFKCDLRISSNEDVIIDTKGFNESDSNNDDTFTSIKEKLNSLDSLDCVIFVCNVSMFNNVGIFKEAIVQLISRVNSEFSRYNKSKSSILLITGCSKDWTQKENQKKNVFLQEALKLCDDKYVELKLDFDQEDEEEDYKVFKQKQRENQIKNFLLKIESYCPQISLKAPIRAVHESTSKRAKIVLRFHKTQIFSTPNT